jgi:hypothetical protein
MGPKVVGVHFNPVMMFKPLVIQTKNTLSDGRMGFIINDLLSLVRFFGLTLGGLYSRCQDDLAVSLAACEGRIYRGVVKPFKLSNQGGRVKRHVRSDH